METNEKIIQIIPLSPGTVKAHFKQEDGSTLVVPIYIAGLTNDGDIVLVDFDEDGIGTPIDDCGNLVKVTTANNYTVEPKSEN